MNYIKYIILGAGPSGLSLAHSLIKNGCLKSDIVVIEKNSSAGGLCRSVEVDGSPLDIGGGHFLDLKRKEVLEFLFHFMPENEWELFNRVSKIRIHDSEIDHPLEANLFQLSSNNQVEYLESISQAGCIRGENIPQTFADWVRWKLGNKIADEYMLPYNRKIWSMSLDLLGIYWLYKLPNVSFRDTLMSCIEKKFVGTLPAHSTFLYPKKFGYGEVWRRMGEELGSSLVLNCPITSIDVNTKEVNRQWCAEIIINTVPWTLWDQFAKLPKEILLSLKSLKNSSIDVDYYPEILNNNSHWIYEPNEEISYHRMLLRSNFIKKSRGYWTETNTIRSPLLKESSIRFHNDFAYPVNTIDKPEAIANILNWAKRNKIFGLGRWGRWEHMNSDVAVAEAMEMGHLLMNGNSSK